MLGTFRIKLRRFTPVLPYFYVASITIVLFTFFSHWAYDDPFITYRYAENLSSGLGMVYNPGERVLSTTTPFFTILLAAISHLWSDLPQAANVISAFSLALGGVILWCLARSWNKPIVGWVALILYPTFVLLLSTIGSESALYLAFCLGSFLFYAQKRYFITAIFTAFAILTRPDGLLIPVILSVDYLIRERSFVSWKVIAVFLGLLLPWVLFAWVYYGSPAPVTLMAKQQQGVMAISEKFAPGLITVAKDYAQKWYYLLEAVLMMVGVVYLFSRARDWGVFLVWSVLYFVAYSVLGVTRYFWYYAPLVPGFLVLVGLGITSVCDCLKLTMSKLIKKKYKNIYGNTMWNNIFKAIPGLVTFCLVALIAVFQINDMWRLRQFSDKRFPIYREVGEWIDENTPSTTVVGSLEIGIIGYYSHRNMIDFAGLVQPEVAKQMNEQTTYEDNALWAVNHFDPDYLVLHDGLFPNLENSYISSRCRHVRTFLGSGYDYAHDMVIYSCGIHS